MKSLSSGLTFVNCATVCGLLIGMVAGGLSTAVAVLSLIAATLAAVFAYLKTEDSTPTAAASDERKRTKYRSIWTWLVASVFFVFAVRSFCWLLYWDGAEFKIQSPFNLGDLGLHVTHIQFFANGVQLWPSNPIYVFSHHLRYPAGIDLFNALLLKVDVDLMTGLAWVGLLASIATFYAFYRWGGAFAVAGFLFNGGIVGFELFRNFSGIKDYQDVNYIAWKSIPLTMFVTQRGLLYAIPAGLLLLCHWREKYLRSSAAGSNVSASTGATSSGRLNRTRIPQIPFWIELSLYASMPLFHVHTFMALSIVLVCLFVAGPPPVRRHVLILLGSAFIPAAFFTWLITDHFHAKSVLEFHWGWVQDDGEFKMPFFRFWFFNFGILIPLGLTLVGLLAWQVGRSTSARKIDLAAAIALATIALSAWCLWKNGFQWVPLGCLFLGIVGLFATGYFIFLTGYAWNEAAHEETAFIFAAGAIFIFTLFVRTAPWGWDNLKIMVWAYFIALPFLWTCLIAQWELPIRLAICVALFGSGFISLLGGLAVGRGGFGFAQRGDVDGVGMAVKKLPLEERFAAYPTYNHPLLLSGRKVVMGYPGHLWTQGFEDYGKTTEMLNKLMQGANDWREMAKRLHVHYIFWGTEEKANYPTSKRPWESIAQVTASGPWGTIYDLEKPKTTPAVPGR